MRRRSLILFAILSAASLLTGCVGKPPALAAKFDNRPTLSLDAVIARINANSGRIQTLNVDGRFDSVIANGRGGFEPLAGGMKLMHTKPNQLIVAADAAAVGVKAFALGSNGTQYWFSAFHNIDTTWYGTPRGTANVDPRLPVAPELLVDVLGVATLDADLLAQPVPTLRYNPDQAVYMLTWHQPTIDRWVTLREVWYDRETFLPTLVILFDRNGRVVLRANLGKYEPIRLESGESADGQPAPLVAREIKMFFPETLSRMTFTLDDVRDRRGGAPRRNSYNFSPERVSTSTVINLDEQPAPTTDAVTPQ